MIQRIIFLDLQAMILHQSVMLTPEQIRAGRALLNWSQQRLAAASGVASQSIKNIERGVTDPRLSTATAIRSALETSGVIFLDEGQSIDGGAGVRLKLSMREVKAIDGLAKIGE